MGQFKIIKNRRVFSPNLPPVNSTNSNGNGHKEWKFNGGKKDAPNQNGTPAVPPGKPQPQPPAPVNYYIPRKKTFFLPGGAKGYAEGNILNPWPDEEEDYTIRILPKRHPPRSRKLW
jgi:hypothetical protein